MRMNLEEKMKKIVEICKRRAITFPTAEIYGGLAGFWEYGPVGTLLKRKLEAYWRCFFVESDDNIVEIEGCTILPEKTFQASGHLKSFVDPITQCKKCKKIYRADHLIKERTGKLVEGLGSEKLTKIIREKEIKCPECGNELYDVRLFNMMLKTEIGPVGGQTAYFRPETAQNIFIDFKRIARAMRLNLPFGIAQVGRSFRNEISPRHFTIRDREFNQYEIEMFLDPKNLDECPKFDELSNTKIRILTREAQKKGKKEIEVTAEEALKEKIVPNKYMAYFLAKEMIFYQNLGIPKEALRFRHMLPEETPHYSKANFDLEIKFPFGWVESVGNALRGDYDLKQHEKYTGEDLSILVNDRKVIPQVVEPSWGVERPIAGILLYCFREGEERGWHWFQFPPQITPFQVAVFPLIKKDERLVKKAREVYEQIRKEFDTIYKEKKSIGARYQKADEIGVLLSLTCDHQTLEDDTLTIRHRDTTKQIRVKITDLIKVIKKILEGKKFEKLGKVVR